MKIGYIRITWASQQTSVANGHSSLSFSYSPTSQGHKFPEHYLPFVIVSVVWSWSVVLSPISVVSRVGWGGAGAGTDRNQPLAWKTDRMCTKRGRSMAPGDGCSFNFIKIHAEKSNYVGKWGAVISLCNWFAGAVHKFYGRPFWIGTKIAATTFHAVERREWPGGCAYGRFISRHSIFESQKLNLRPDPGARLHTYKLRSLLIQFGCYFLSIWCTTTNDDWQ